MQANWKDKISNTAQLGGIETSVLDNGSGRGVRIAWINTGSGLRFKLVLDRAMDIADTFFNQHSMAWISHAGISAPQPLCNDNSDWLKTFGGGLMTTCGLSHVGGTETDEFGTRSLHGNISNLPAEIISIVQPDIIAGNFDMSITGLIKESQVLGPNLQLKRTISAKLGQAVIYVHDEVTNLGNLQAPHMILYHLNFGWPLVDAGTEIQWEGKWYTRDGNYNKIFNSNNNFKVCPQPLDDHSGTGEAVGMIDIDADEEGWSHCGLLNKNLAIQLTIKFKKGQLPWLINWQHWGKGEYVTGLEPSTNKLTGQAKARQDNELIFIKPGETKHYDLQIEVKTL